jgi:DNA polymerase III epsilon subunit-like protein
MGRRKASVESSEAVPGGTVPEGFHHSVAFFDTETTGVDIDTAELIELAVIRKFYDEAGAEVGVFERVRRYRSHNPIPPEASAVHDIVDEDIAGKPFFGPEATDCPEDYEILEHLFMSDVIVAHNLKYDTGIMRRYYPDQIKVFEPEERRVDTLRLAQHFFPEIESHSMKAMRYRFHFDKMAGHRLESHSALDDTKMLLYFMQMVSETFPLMGPYRYEWWKAMAIQSASPVMVQRFPFGKHRGDLVDNVVQSDPQYIHWCMQQDWMKTDNPDLYHTLLTYTHRKPMELFSHVRNG